MATQTARTGLIRVINSELCVLRAGVYYVTIFTFSYSVFLLALSLSPASPSHAQKLQTFPGPDASDNSARMLHTVPGNGPYQRPARLENLTYLSPGLYNIGLTRPQWTEVLLTWLAEERNNPTPTATGLGGGPIDSSYIQVQIIKGLGDQGSPLVLGTLVASPDLNDEGIRDALHLALARMGAKGQGPAVRRLLAHPDPQFRALAVECCYDIGLKEALPDLQTALQDPYSESFVSIHEGLVKFYPVRRLAKETIRNLNNPTIMEDVRERNNRYNAKVENERQAIAICKVATKKLMVTLNSHKKTRLARNLTKK